MEFQESSSGISPTRGFAPQHHAVIQDEATGVKTEIMCCSFADRHLVVISQKEKFGTVISAWSEAGTEGTKIYMMDTLLGRRDDPLLNVYARQIVENIATTSDLPLLLCICLDKDGRSTRVFQDILNKLYSIRTW